MILLAGLGNPGPQYEKTRHNMGYRVVEDFARRHRLIFRPSKFYGLLAKMKAGDEKIFVVKPHTFMNDSGRCIGALMRYYGICPENLLVVYDDIDLPLGKLRLRQKGSAGTHNGMRSVITELGTENFNRLRVGIEAPHPLVDLRSHVLGKLTEDEEKVLSLAIENASKALDLFLEQGMEKAMQVYNANDTNR